MVGTLYFTKKLSELTVIRQMLVYPSVTVRYPKIYTFILSGLQHAFIHLLFVSEWRFCFMKKLFFYWSKFNLSRRRDQSRECPRARASGCGHRPVTRRGYGRASAVSGVTMKYF